MYQARVSNVVVPSESIVTADVDDAMWKLFVAIGNFWKLEDDPEPYRLRFRGFMENRISINPMYRDFYVVAKTVIDEFIAQFGEAALRAVVYAKAQNSARRSSSNPVGIRSTVCCERVYWFAFGTRQFQGVRCRQLLRVFWWC